MSNFYPDFDELLFDKRIIDALKKTAEKIRQETHDRIRGQHPWQETMMDDSGNLYFHEDIDPNKTYRAEKIHPQSLLTLYGWTGIWNSLNTVQKIKVFRFVYNVENAEIYEE
jgi:hypothetical protein